MRAERYIRRFNHLNGKPVSKHTLTQFHTEIKKELSSKRIDASSPGGLELIDIEKRMSNVIGSMANGEIIDITVMPVNISKINRIKSTPVKKVTKKKVIQRGHKRAIGDISLAPKPEPKPFVPKSLKVHAPMGIKEIAKVGTQKQPRMLSGVVSAAALAGLKFVKFMLTGQWLKDFYKINSDTIMMVWGAPGSGKTVYLLKFAMYLAKDLMKRVLYISAEEYGRSTLTEKINEFHIDGFPFTDSMNEKDFDNYDVIFIDSINKLGISLRDFQALVKRHPNKMFVLIVQSTKDGDFRGGKDWEHEVDVAGEIVNRRMILRKNRMDPDFKEKADKLRIDDEVALKTRSRKINDMVKKKVAPIKKAA